MTGVRMAALLSGFLATEARKAVVRVRDAEGTPDTVFSGFFISPEGHLVTAFHTIKTHAFDLPCEFAVRLEFDTGSADNGDHHGVVTTARCEPNWCDRAADWAVLRVNYSPSSFLPISAADVMTLSGDGLCSELRVYGFTATEPGLPRLGALSGQYLRSVPAKRRFHVAFLVRSRGQSGGPVIDLRSHGVVGSVVGYRQDEQLTADIAALDQAKLAPLGLDLHGLAQDWRVRAASYACAHHPEFTGVTSGESTPSTPEHHVSCRSLVTEIESLLLSGRLPGYLHGPPGSGKTVLAVEIAKRMLERRAVETVFWHDFDAHENRSTDHLLRRLAVHLLRHDENFELLDACLDDRFRGDSTDAVNALTSALRNGSHLLVFDNLQFVLRGGRPEMASLLDRIASAARGGTSMVLFTSWDHAQVADGLTTHRVDGFTDQEVRQLVAMHQVNVSPEAIEWVSQLATDITCVESFLRSAAWRAEIEAGRFQATEPAELHRYWLGRFLASAPGIAHRVLLALAVFAQPVTRDLVEEVAEIEDFAATLDLLLTSPPLVRTSNDDFYLHDNVTKAILAVSDKAAIRAAHQRAGQAFRQRADFISAARHNLSAGDPAIALDLLFRTREQTIAAGRVQELERLAEHVRSVAPDHPDLSPRVHAILASCRNIRGDYVGSTRHWGFALRRMPSGSDAAVVRNRKGDSHRLASDYQAARVEYETAAELVRSEDSSEAIRELGRANLGLAKLDRLSCAYLDAKRRYREAGEAFQVVFDQVGLMEADFGLGEVSRLAAEWDAAMESYEASRARARGNANLEREAYALWGIGELQRLTGAHTEAQQTHQAGLALCVRVGDVRSEGWALLGLAENARMTGATEAWDHHLLAHQKFTQTGSKTEIAHATLGKAEALRATGRTDLALYEQALDTYLARNLTHCVVVARLGYAAALRSAQQTGLADDELDHAIRLAQECSLARELAHAELMRDDAGASPFLALNFP
jgi:tetratricopeptide (TPR) repeat protein